MQDLSLSRQFPFRRVKNAPFPFRCIVKGLYHLWFMYRRVLFFSRQGTQILENLWPFVVIILEHDFLAVNWSWSWNWDSIFLRLFSLAWEFCETFSFDLIWNVHPRPAELFLSFGSFFAENIWEGFLRPWKFGERFGRQEGNQRVDVYFRVSARKKTIFDDRRGWRGVRRLCEIRKDLFLRCFVSFRKVKTVVTLAHFFSRIFGDFPRSLRILEVSWI